MRPVDFEGLRPDFPLSILGQDAVRRSSKSGDANAEPAQLELLRDSLVERGTVPKQIVVTGCWRNRMEKKSSGIWCTVSSVLVSDLREGGNFVS